MTSYCPASHSPIEISPETSVIFSSSSPTMTGTLSSLSVATPGNVVIFFVPQEPLSS